MSCLSTPTAAAGLARGVSPRQLRAEAGVAALALLSLCVGGRPAHAQYVQNYFPAGVPGYDAEAGVTVLSRQRSLYDEPITHIGSFNFQVGLNEAISYDSNIEGRGGGPGSEVFDTSSAIIVKSDWSRNALGLSLSADDSRYPNVPGEDHTDWTVGIGGGYTLGRGNLTLSYAHLALHEVSTDLAALATTNAVAYSVDDIRASYNLVAGRFTFTPNIDVQDYGYGSAIIGGRRDDESYRNRRVLVGGVTTHLDLGSNRSLLLELQGVQTSYLNLPRGFLDNGSSGVLALGGLDYQANGIFQYRVLGGVETRSFAASAYGSQTAPIVEASVIWTPTGLTTVTDTLAREIESPASADIGSYTLTSNTLVIDHELRRNILLQAHLTTQLAEYLHQGSQNSIDFGLKATWLVSRNMRLSAEYNASTTSGVPVFNTNVRGAQNAMLSGGYTDNRFTLALHVAF